MLQDQFWSNLTKIFSHAIIAHLKTLSAHQIVGRGHAKPEEGKLTAVKEYPQPQTKKDVRAFLGLAGYYRHFIPHFASIATLLTNLTKNTTRNCVM